MNFIQTHNKGSGYGPIRYVSWTTTYLIYGYGWSNTTYLYGPIQPIYILYINRRENRISATAAQRRLNSLATVCLISRLPIFPAQSPAAAESDPKHLQETRKLQDLAII
jgi:hypothetical protein